MNTVIIWQEWLWNLAERPKQCFVYYCVVLLDLPLFQKHVFSTTIFGVIFTFDYCYICFCVCFSSNYTKCWKWISNITVLKASSCCVTFYPFIQAALWSLLKMLRHHKLTFITVYYLIYGKLIQWFPLFVHDEYFTSKKVAINFFF